MGFEDQNPGDCPGCREYEQERQRIAKENEDLRIHCAMLDAALTEAETSAANRLVERDNWRKAALAKDEALDLLDLKIERLQQFLRTCVDKMIDYEVDDTQDNADFIVDCAAAAGLYPEDE